MFLLCGRAICGSPRQLSERILRKSLRNMSAEGANVAAQLRRDVQQQQNTAGIKKKHPSAYIPGTVQVQILGAGTNGAPSAVYLFTDQSRYLFNCGEGTQRLAHEHKTKLARLEQIFVTRNTWAMMGGLPGLALTVQDAGVRELALYGPPHLDSILMSMKRFVVLKTLQVRTNDCRQLHEFEDSVMRVQCVPLYKDNVAAGDNLVLAYICKLKPRPGPLNLVKCVERGVPPGPLLGLLKNGSDVTLPDGRLIKSKDVSEPSETPLSFVFLDVPTEEYLPALHAHTALFHDPNAEHQVVLVVHFSPPHIVANSDYCAFTAKFCTAAQHVYLGDAKNCFSGYIAAHRIQYQLNQLHPRIFPLLGESALPCGASAAATSISSKLKKTKLFEDEAAQATTTGTDEVTNTPSNDGLGINSLTTFHLRPPKGLDHSLAARLNPSEYIDEAQALPGLPALLEKLRAEQQTLELRESTTATELYPKITFLGTGSCIPNKTRNVSAILVQPHASSYMLLDCGEGTLGQIVRFFGAAQAEEVLRQLRAIYVSHLHADHHIGLIGLLTERQRLLGDATASAEERVLLFAPKQIKPWLDFYDERIESISAAYELIGNAEMLQQPLELESAGRRIEGVQTIATCLVRHCPHSFGVSLTGVSGSEPFKITYSGDSMPCQDLVELGRNSTILIHEATMEDDLVDEARIKMHSTISQAIEQGRAMQAEHIVLTHFSQRYAKLPRMQNPPGGGESDRANGDHTMKNGDNSMHNVAIAFDNMQVTRSDLQQFQLLYPALRALFAEHAEELEQKALKRELKLERKRKLLNAN